jgi:hypothetical protein
MLDFTLGCYPCDFTLGCYPCNLCFNDNPDSNLNLDLNNDPAVLGFILDNAGSDALLSSYDSAALDMTFDNARTDLLEVDMDEGVNASPTPKLFTVRRVLQGNSPEYFKNPRVTSTSFKDFKIITTKL